MLAAVAAVSCWLPCLPGTLLLLPQAAVEALPLLQQLLLLLLLLLPAAWRVRGEGLFDFDGPEAAPPSSAAPLALVAVGLAKLLSKAEVGESAIDVTLFPTGASNSLSSGPTSAPIS